MRIVDSGQHRIAFRGEFVGHEQRLWRDTVWRPISDEETGVKQESKVIVLQNWLTPDTDQQEHNCPEKDGSERQFNLISGKPIPIK